MHYGHWTFKKQETLTHFKGRPLVSEGERVGPVKSEIGRGRGGRRRRRGEFPLQITLEIRADAIGRRVGPAVNTFVEPGVEIKGQGVMWCKAHPSKTQRCRCWDTIRIFVLSTHLEMI